MQEISSTGPWETRLAFIDPSDQGDFEGDHGTHDGMEHNGHGSQFYRTTDGRLIIRERGCPELKPQTQQRKDRLFTVVRRPEDLEKEEHDEEIQNAAKRNIHTAPMVMQSADNTPRDQTHAQNSQESLDARGSEGSRMTSIDDNRLRRLLEELYKDKKYFDYYIDHTEPKSEAIIVSKGLAEHGRGYLLERADYWERRGPLPPRPPQTAVGWRMMRQQTQWTIRDGPVQRASTTMTYTPTQESIPGTIDSPRDDVKENNQTKLESEGSNSDISNNEKVTNDAGSREGLESEA